PHERVGYEADELATGASAYLKVLRAPRGSDDDARPLWGTDLHGRTEMFVLAFACWRNGLKELAAELYDQAARTPTGYGYEPDKPPTQPLQSLVAQRTLRTHRPFNGLHRHRTSPHSWQGDTRQCRGKRAYSAKDNRGGWSQSAGTSAAVRPEAARRGGI